MSMQVEMVAEAASEEQVHVTTTLQAPVLDKALFAQLVGDAQASGLGIDGENGLLA